MPTDQAISSSQPTATVHGTALGLHLVTPLSTEPYAGGFVMHILWTDTVAKAAESDKRSTDRRAVAMPARLTWKDQRGATRFATVVAKNVSEYGVYVECYSPVSIPLYRLVQFQLERDAPDAGLLPTALQRACRVLSAVYRVSPPSSSKPQGLALRLMVDPRRAVAVEQTRATA